MCCYIPCSFLSAIGHPALQNACIWHTIKKSDLHNEVHKILFLFVCVCFWRFKRIIISVKCCWNTTTHIFLLGQRCEQLSFFTSTSIFQTFGEPNLSWHTQVGFPYLQFQIPRQNLTALSFSSFIFHFMHR